MSMTTLQWPDYLILVAFLVISLGIGVYHSLTGGKQRTVQEFVLANRRLGILPTSISLLVSFKSAILNLGMAAEMYQFGIFYMIWVLVACPLAILIVERLIVPWMYPLKLLSINDYLEQRFESKAVRMFGAISTILGGIVYMGVAMYAPSAALEVATGLPRAVSIPLMAVVSIAYTALGGMRAVIWTDVFQFFIMIGGMLAILIKGVVIVGGFGEVMEVCRLEGRFTNAANWSFDPTVRHTVWGLIFGITVNWVQLYGLNQASVQRFSSTETMTGARLVVLLNIPCVIFMIAMACLTGLTVFAYYAKIQCDPLVNKDVSNANQLLSLFVTTIFSNSPGFSGLFLATLYGGSLSSISSALSGSAAVFWDDVLKLKLSHLAETRKALLNRFLVVVFGSMAMLIAFLSAVVPGPVSQIVASFCATVAGPIFGIFVIGCISRHGNSKGVLIGGTVSLIFSFWLTTGALLNQLASELTGIRRFYAISYTWYCTIGTVISVVIGLIASLFFRDREAESRVDDRLLISFRQLYRCTGLKRSSSTTKSHPTDETRFDAELARKSMAVGIANKASTRYISNPSNRTVVLVSSLFAMNVPVLSLPSTGFVEYAERIEPLIHGPDPKFILTTVAKGDIYKVEVGTDRNATQQQERDKLLHVSDSGNGVNGVKTRRDVTPT